jgi:heme/copper-type cytochrome/quinol oxidase subunit 2
MNRDLIMSVLLIIAGIVLAIALFAAGAVWKGRSNRHNSGLFQDASFPGSQCVFVRTMTKNN